MVVQRPYGIIRRTYGLEVSRGFCGGPKLPKLVVYVFTAQATEVLTVRVYLALLIALEEGNKTARAEHMAIVCGDGF